VIPAGLLRPDGRRGKEEKHCGEWGTALKAEETVEVCHEMLTQCFPAAAFASRCSMAPKRWKISRENLWFISGFGVLTFAPQSAKVMREPEKRKTSRS
jgi:hypothetical protein